MATLKFPGPHEVGTISGTDGWQRMYPYQYSFSTDNPERTEYENSMFWFYDGLHYPEPMYPFDMIWDEAWYLALSQYNTRIFCVPPVYGIDHRIINGYIYISPVSVKDPKEVEERITQFMERAGYYYRNWDSIVAKWETKMKALIDALENKVNWEGTRGTIKFSKDKTPAWAYHMWMDVPVFIIQYTKANQDPSQAAILWPEKHATVKAYVRPAK